MRKWIIIIIVLLGLTLGGRILWNASRPVVLSNYRSIGGRAYDGSSETYRELGGFSVTRWKYRQWFQERDFVVLAGCVVADQPRTKVGFGVGGSEWPDRSSVVWTADVGVIGADHRTMIPKISVSVEYDLIARTATLLNTGEVHPLSSEKIFTVYVNEQFEIDRFVVLDPEQELTDVHPKLAENFAKVVARRHEIAEQDAEDGAANRAPQP